jgi:hypothetical protein
MKSGFWFVLVLALAATFVSGCGGGGDNHPTPGGVVTFRDNADGGFTALRDGVAFATVDLPVWNLVDTGAGGGWLGITPDTSTSPTTFRVATSGGTADVSAKAFVSSGYTIDPSYTIVGVTPYDVVDGYPRWHLPVGSYTLTYSTAVGTTAGAQAAPSHSRSVTIVVVSSTVDPVKAYTAGTDTELGKNASGDYTGIPGTRVDLGSTNADRIEVIEPGSAVPVSLALNANHRAGYTPPNVGRFILTAVKGTSARSALSFLTVAVPAGPGPAGDQRRHFPPPPLR